MVPASLNRFSAPIFNRNTIIRTRDSRPSIVVLVITYGIKSIGEGQSRRAISQAVTTETRCFNSVNNLRNGVLNGQVSFSLGTVAQVGYEQAVGLTE